MTKAPSVRLSDLDLDFRDVNDLRFLIEDALAARGCPISGDEGVEEHFLCLREQECLSVVTNAASNA